MQFSRIHNGTRFTEIFLRLLPDLALITPHRPGFSDQRPSWFLRSHATVSTQVSVQPKPFLRTHNSCQDHITVLGRRVPTLDRRVTSSRQTRVWHRQKVQFIARSVNTIIYHRCQLNCSHQTPNFTAKIHQVQFPLEHCLRSHRRLRALSRPTAKLAEEKINEKLKVTWRNARTSGTEGRVRGPGNLQKRPPQW